MEAAQALADLTEISAQIEAAVLARVEGDVVAATLAETGKAEALTEAARELLAAAEEAAGSAGGGLSQLEAATAEGSVFVVRDGEHLVAAVTSPKPTVGLVFYDLRTCLRLLVASPEEAGDGDTVAATAKPGRRKPGKDSDGDS